jgi:hypothetical protein
MAHPTHQPAHRQSDIGKQKSRDLSQAEGEKLELRGDMVRFSQAKSASATNPMRSRIFLNFFTFASVYSFR